MTDPGIYEVEVEAGRMEPLNPDYGVIFAARWFRITPMEYMEMPAYWAGLGAVVRQAENDAHQSQNRKQS